MHTVAHFREVIEVTADCAVVGVDMPMALPKSGVRASDVELRAWLGSASRSLFYTPTRAALEAESHAEAVRVNKAAGGKGPSAQGWGLAAKIREVRATLGPDPDHRFVEVHPESSFLMMNQQEHLATKRSAKGVGQRSQLLTAAGFAPAAMLAQCGPGPKVDDALDAMAACWTAARLAAGTAQWFGVAGSGVAWAGAPRSGAPERDDQGWCPGVAV